MSATSAMTAEELRRLLEQNGGGGVSAQVPGAEDGAEDDLALSLSKLLHLPHIEIPEVCHIERSILRLVPESTARQYSLIPYAQPAVGALIVVMANPLDLDGIDAVRSQTGLEIHPAVAREEDVLALIERAYREEEYLDEGLREIVDLNEETEAMEGEAVTEVSTRVELDDLKMRANDTPVVRFVNLLLMAAVRDRASDIHFEPAEKTVQVRFRIDGVLCEVTPPPRSLYAAVATRIKILSELDIAEHRMPQDGRFKFKVKDRIIDVRVSVLPVAHGEKLVLRLLDRASLLVDMADVGFDPPMLKEFRRVLKLPNGIILLTGPTGSGKTTTLYSALSYLKDPRFNIQTVEDPIEYLIDGINQTQIHPRIGLDFAACLRAILRQDPDIMMIGEIRDLETAQIATRSSLTGHLVLSSLHTNDAPSSFSRLRDIGVPSYLIAATVKLVIAQRLVRVICSRCKTDYTPPAEQVELISTLYPDAPNWRYVHGAGCVECQQTGFYGRTGIFEFLEVDDTIREHIGHESNDIVMRRAAIDAGMESLLSNGLHKVQNGTTTIDEVLRASQQL